MTAAYCGDTAGSGPAGAAWHRRRGQKPCEQCAENLRAYVRAAYRRRVGGYTRGPYRRASGAWW